MVAKLVSIQVGQPQTYHDDQGTWETSFFKVPVQGTIFLGALGLEGDAVADRKHHGGPDQAVLLYSADHYALWRVELDVDLPSGALAENLTVSGIDENTVYIDDIYQVGPVKLRVTRPRIPCWKIARRWNLPDLTKRVTQTGRTGWYCRVLQEGEIEAGLPVELCSRSDTGQTVAQNFQAYLNSKLK